MVKRDIHKIIHPWIESGILWSVKLAVKKITRIDSYLFMVSPLTEINATK